MDKYYTPDISEFHVGFEFKEESISKLMYHKKTFRFEWFDLQKEIITGIDNKKIRVKYLDKEDIESLGWNLDKVHEGKDQELFHKDNIVLYYRYKTKELGIFTRDPSKNDYYSKYNMDPYRIQSLIIKNKSELIKLLKQLQIG